MKMITWDHSRGDSLAIILLIFRIQFNLSLLFYKETEHRIWSSRMKEEEEEKKEKGPSSYSVV
jgi:hypothetical protein